MRLQVSEEMVKEIRLVGLSVLAIITRLRYGTTESKLALVSGDGEMFASSTMTLLC